ncbi:Transcription elongation factor SPT5 [Gracilaria domingensis]|nr:Transcription elongation factor SPT5 [Gracilaria domingensis]
MVRHLAVYRTLLTRLRFQCLTFFLSSPFALNLRQLRASTEYEDADDADQYSDYEDADEAPVKGPKKKKRRKTMALLDLEAEEDDAEDEDEEEEVAGLIADDDDHDANLDRDREQMRAQRFERQRAMESEDPENLERYFEERYAYVDEEQGAPDTSGVDQQSLLPTIHDPRIFIVKCKKIGHERRAIFSLLQKMFNYRRRGVDLGIFSAIAPQHLKGRVYIEAVSSVQVEAAIQGLDLFTTYEGIKPLQLDEMVDVLQIGKRSEKQAVGNWVRLGRGMYKGDLAQVCGVRDGYGEGQVLIRLIPRLDYKGDKDYMEELDKEDGNDDVDVSGTRRKGRPPQKLFDKKELYRLTGSSDIYTQRDRNTGAVYEVWNEELFRYGLLHKWISPRTLVTGDAVQPQVEELEKWMMAEQQMRSDLEETNENGETNDEAAQGLNLDISSIAGRRGTKLYKGDSVKVVAGEQKGLAGKIEALREDVVLLRCDDFPEPLSVSRSDVVKVFKSGEPVRIASGQYAGYSGTIVAVDGDFLTVFTDSTRENIRVVSAQVADASDMNIDYSQQRSGMGAARQQYELFDLVQMLDDPIERCVVIQVRNDGVKLLNTRNNSSVHPLSAIKGRVRDLSARAVDSRGFPIAANDSIHVVSGIHKDRQGIVQHVAGSYVFFKARDEIKHCGLVAVPASQCTASTAAARRLSSTGQALQDSLTGPSALPRGSISSFGGGGGFGGFGSSGGRRGPVRDELFRADVKIKRGPYKGHSGKVVEVSDSTVRVELISKMKTITVQRAWVRKMGDAPNGNPSINGGFGRGRGTTSSRPPLPSSTLAGSRTPRYSQTPRSDGAYRSQTPRLGGFGGATPRYGAATPRGNATPGSNFGAQTPGRDTFGSRTPAHHEPFGYNNPPRTPANPYGAYPSMPTTPGGGAAPARLGSDYPALEPNTPGGPIEPRTPAYQSYEASTPAPGMEPTTPAPGGAEPRTPAPQYEPRTPAAFEPRTPMVQEPATPHASAIPQTPHPQEEPSQGTADYRVLIDVEVIVRDENNSPGVVVDASPSGSEIIVKMISGEKKGERIRVTDITPVQPRSDTGEVQELVKVLDGKHVGKRGRLLGLLPDQNDKSEGRIRFEGGQEVVLQMDFVAKCYEEGK